MHYVYIIKNKSGRTYIGYTVDPEHRLRQHNGCIAGGAKYTSKNDCGSWEFIAIISGFPDNHNALQCEWRLKHPDKKRKNKSFRGIQGRLKGVIFCLKDDYWTSQSIISVKDINLTIQVREEYSSYLKNLPSNVQLVFL
jgi:structure-specific endonuclease subunit SLX1